MRWHGITGAIARACAIADRLAAPHVSDIQKFTSDVGCVIESLVTISMASSAHFVFILPTLAAAFNLSSADCESLSLFVSSCTFAGRIDVTRVSSLSAASDNFSLMISFSVSSGILSVLVVPCLFSSGFAMAAVVDDGVVLIIAGMRISSISQ